MYKELVHKIAKGEEELKKTYSEEEVMELLKKTVKNSIYKHTGKIISEEELEKSFIRAFKNGVALTALLNGAYYMGPQIESNQQDRQPAQVKEINSQPKSFETNEDNQDSFRNKKIKNFLKTISMNESSGGKNINHRRMESGIHAGTAAQGQYGLMPNTVKEMATRMGRENPMYRYAKMDPKDIEKEMKANPDHQEQIATFMANKLHDRFGGDESKMAYSWNMGHNLDNNNETFTSGKYKEHPYVQKYSKNRQTVEKTPVQNIADNSN